MPARVEALRSRARLREPREKGVSRRTDGHSDDDVACDDGHKTPQHETDGDRHENGGPPVPCVVIWRRSGFWR